MSKLGVTATRNGLTNLQKMKFSQIMLELRPTELHHGDCIGGDDDCHSIAMSMLVPVVQHPPTDSRHRAFTLGCREHRAPKPYRDRNEDIVDETDLLVALPEGPEESFPRSGTWMTVRYADKRDKDIYIVWPDGTVEFRPRKQNLLDDIATWVDHVKNGPDTPATQVILGSPGWPAPLLRRVRARLRRQVGAHA